MNQHYTIQPVQNSKPRRYQVMFGSIPMSRPMAKKEAEQYMQMMLGNVDSVLASWNGLNSRG
jgi:hypothetical protein